jgi:TPR repeat protein
MKYLFLFEIWLCLCSFCEQKLSGQTVNKRLLNELISSGHSEYLEDIDDVFRNKLNAAQHGDVDAQVYLGLSYDLGRNNREINYYNAFKWYNQAASQDNIQAQNNLGVNYYYGKGTERNYFEAVKWFKKAAEQGDGRAHLNLGNCYYEGKGIVRNIAEAKKLWEQVLKSMDLEAIEEAKKNLEFLKTGDGKIKTINVLSITKDFNDIFK